MTTSYFSKIFGKSPVTPLQVHIDKVIECVDKLEPYFSAVLTEDWETAKDCQKQLESLEHEADEIKNELRINMSISLFMPVDRRDILEILDLQDSMANRAKDISGLVLGRRMKLPVEIADQYMSFLGKCLEAAHQAQIAINRLDELLETGFRGNEADNIKDMIVELQRIEDETDEDQVKIRAALYSIEDRLSPIDAMFLYEIFEWTGDLADRAQSTGNRLQLILAK